MVPVLLGLGANIGDRAAALSDAVAGLTRLIAVTGVSPVYETAPMYVTDQARFLNMAVSGETGLAPEDLLAGLKELEARLGRTPSARFGPRRIDIDILLYGDRIVEAEGLQVPHPRMAERAFVLIPAADIAGGWRHPETGRMVAEMLAALGPAGDVERREDIVVGAGAA